VGASGGVFGPIVQQEEWTAYWQCWEDERLRLWWLETSVYILIELM